MAQATTIVNKFGRLQGWNQVKTNTLSRDLEGINELNYTDNMDIQGVKGAGKFDIGYTDTQNYVATASFTILKEEMDALLRSYPVGTRIQDIPLGDIVVAYELPDGSLLCDIIREARIRNQGRNVKQNDGSIWTTYELYTPLIDWNQPL